MERLICLGIGYIFGMFQTGYLVGKSHHIDIRQCGSGNAGTTNALRTLGKKAGAITLLGDMFKCVLAILLVDHLFKNNYQDILPLLGMYTAAGCVLGHNFPFYLHFKGGKGVAASAGMLIALDWKVFLIAAGVFLILFFTIHYVSVGSISAYITALICFVVFGAMGCYGMDLPHTVEMDVVMGLMTVLAVYRHRSNISRLLSGKESKVYLGKTGKRE